MNIIKNILFKKMLKTIYYYIMKYTYISNKKELFKIYT